MAMSMMAEMSKKQIATHLVDKYGGVELLHRERLIIGLTRASKDGLLWLEDNINQINQSNQSKLT
jgi:hypothetical protein